MSYKPDTQTLERLSALSARTQQSLDDLVNEAVQQFLAQQEDAEELALCRTRLEEYKKAGECIDHAEATNFFDKLSTG